MKRDSEVKGKQPSTLCRTSLGRLPCAPAVRLAMAAAGQSLTMRVGARHVTSGGNVNRRLLIPARTAMAGESYRSSQVWLAETVCLLGTWVRSQLTADSVHLHPRSSPRQLCHRQLSSSVRFLYPLVLLETRCRVTDS